MEGYRYQQIAYLILPLTLGAEFFRTARAERKKTGKEYALSVVMDGLGYVFIGVLPALFLFTIICLEMHYAASVDHILHRVDRYGVMFFFFGSWWQVFLMTSLRARRAEDQGHKFFLSIWLPYLAFGAFISALVLWVAPWNLMWVSMCWFIGTFGIFTVFGVRPATVSKIFLIFTIFVLACENILFIILDAIV